MGLLRVEDFVVSNLPSANIKILLRAIDEGLVGHQNIEYIPIFSFLYSDSHNMVTIGGIIGSNGEKRRLAKINRDGAVYLRTRKNEKPYIIKVPILTRKERLRLDPEMPCTRGWQPSEFTLPPEQLQAYSEIYRFLPAYAELLI